MVGEAETWSHQTFDPPTVRRDLTNTELLTEERGVHAPRQASQPLGPALERGAPKMSGFENQRDLHPRDPTGYREQRFHS